MNKKLEGKIIRGAVVAGVVLLHFAAAYVVGGVIQSLYSGTHTEEYAEILPEPEAIPGANRGPASVAKPRTTRSRSSSEKKSRDEGREVEGSGEYSFSAGGEESGSFVENFFQYLETGNWPDSAEKKAQSPDPKKDEIYGIGGARLSGTLGAANRASDSSGGSTTSSTPTINVMPPFFVSNPTGGINSVTTNNFKVSATGGAALSSIHGVTSSGYRVWFNQGGQASGQ